MMSNQCCDRESWLVFWLELPLDEDQTLVPTSSEHGLSAFDRMKTGSCYEAIVVGTQHFLNDAAGS
jgi:hypothetical protein